MGWLDSLFVQSDPRESNASGGSGWLGPIAGCPVGFDRTQPPRLSPMPPANAPAVPAAPSGIPGGREGAEPNPSMPLLGVMGAGASGGSAGLFGQGSPGSASQDPTLLDRLTAGAANLTTGGNPVAGLLNAVNGLATGQRTDRAGIELAKQHATMSALMNAGLDLAAARAAAINPDFLKALVVARYGVRPTRGQVATPPHAGTEESARKEPAPVGDGGAQAGAAPDGAKPRS